MIKQMENLLKRAAEFAQQVEEELREYLDPTPEADTPQGWRPLRKYTTLKFGEPRDGFHIGEQEALFREQHLGHTLSLREGATSGIGINTSIRCQTCHSKYQDVSAYEHW